MKHLALGCFLLNEPVRRQFVSHMNLERQNRKGNGDHPHRTVLYRNKEKDLDRKPKSN